MQDMPLPPDSGFVVDWQMPEEGPVVDLSAAESEVILPDDASVRVDLGLGADR
jgi:hypothetical protein